MPTFTKAKIADAVALPLNCDHRQSGQVVECLLDIIKETLAAGEDLLISGFGKFEVKKKRPRVGRNPATGEQMTLPGRQVVVFKCSNKLRQRVDEQ